MNTNLFLKIVVLVFFTLPGVLFGQAPDLGTTADFVLFSSSGAVTNTGISHLTGNVGTNSGSSTGFGNVNGVMHDNDLASGQCSADLGLLYNQLNSAIPTLFPATLLGNGDTLVPGIYYIGAPATLDLNLYLDAQGNPNAIFIIQIQGAFSTNANSKVHLIGGAMACNVFWKVEGLIDMAAGTTMRGTLIANNAGINMNTNNTLEGRALSTTGAITVDGVLAYTPIGCGSPYLTGPVGPPLGTTECYTIFSSDGSVTNTGITNVTGDVGTNVGSTTGFDPLLVLGAIHPIPDGSTAAAAADLLLAYGYLNTLPHDIELLYPAQFGNSLVLTPHTYLVNGAVTFTDTLFLDAQGNNDAVFVIKIYGALSTSTYSKVSLINGTQIENVYWMINGLVTISDYSEFVGTIVCNNAGMNLLQGTLLNGRAMTTVGALNTNAITAIMPIGCVAASSPIIVTQPSDQIVCDGDVATFTVIATGTDLAYQWRIGSVNLINGGNISGATSATLTIDPASALDVALDYNVVVSGLLLPNDTSINVSLSIDSIPVITSQPTDQSVCEGDPANFTVVATGTGLTYQWRIGLVNLIDGGNISGATTATLTIDPVSALDAALDYNVVVGGTCLPNEVSINVSLSVDSIPVITSQPTDQSVCEGDPANFTVVATGKGLTYQWRIGLVNLIDGGNILGATTSTLTIDPVSALDEALDYNVVVGGTCLPNEVSINVSLSIDSGPVITSQPTDQSVCEGDPASFTVVATGTGLTYQWRIGLVDLIDGGNISGATTATLTIDPVSALDAALDYNVVVGGTCLPNEVSINVSLSIGSSPVITSQPTNQSVCEGDLASFTVVATGADLTYQWRIGLVNLIDGGNISGATTATLTIDPTALSDTAPNYNVVISGGCVSTDTSSVGLSTAGGFGILAGTAITSTGFTEIHNMDVGLSPGVRSSITGFPPAIVVNGAIYASDDVAPPGVAAMLIQAKQDLTDAYLYAEGATAPAPQTVAGDQGGTTLTPGIYKSTSTLLIQSGDLTLDAQGDVNAKWIFQIASDFTTIGGAGGNVILTGGAQADNITWQVGSSATIGNYTSFSGNILALTSITMNTGSSINGRLLARNGAVVLSGTNMINAPSDSVVAAVSQIISVNVSLMVNPVFTVNNPQTICDGESYVINGNTYTITGNYEDTLTSVHGCDSIVLTQLTVNPVFTVNNPQTICDGESYVINGNTYTITGNYEDTLTSVNGCDSIVVTQLTVNPLPVAIASSNSPVCVGNTITLFAQTVVGGSYYWTGPSAFTSIDQNPQILNATSNEAGIYALTVSLDGCNSVISETPVFVDDCDVDLSILKTANTLNPMIGQTVVFTLTATNNGPYDATGVEVTDILQSGFTYISSTVSVGDFDPLSGIWTIGDMVFQATEVMTISVLVNSTGIYSNTGSIIGIEQDNNVVNNISTIELIPTDFFIPEGFSPNSDGINDLFVIRGIDNYPLNTILIFNRWGNKVFEANPYQNTWDGNCSFGIQIGSGKLPVGTYFYVLDLGDGSDVFKGTVYLNY